VFRLRRGAQRAIQPPVSARIRPSWSAPCINSSNADILNWSILRPETIEKVRGLEEWTGRTFFYPVRRDSVPNRIDEVVGWARTSRGGKQEPFPIFDERAACESKYGLCE
jgi:hypothetical protein